MYINIQRLMDFSLVEYDFYEQPTESDPKKIEWFDCKL